MRRKINLENMVRTFVLMVLDILLVRALITGEILEYVHPRNKIYLWLAVVLLALMIIFSAMEIVKPKHIVNLMPYAIIGLPLVLFFIMPKVTDPQLANTPQLVEADQVAGDSTLQGEEEAVQDSEGTGIPNSSATSDISAQEDMADKKQEPAYKKRYEDGHVVADEDFANWFIEVYDHMEAYDGMQVTVKGQVLKNDTLAANEFVPTRGVMTCCIADIQYYGFVCRGEQAKIWENDSWVWVTGTLRVVDYMGSLEPIIEIKEVKAAQPPTEKYAYFS